MTRFSGWVRWFDQLIPATHRVLYIELNPERVDAGAHPGGDWKDGLTSPNNEDFLCVSIVC